jgi:hypothetical protein
LEQLIGREARGELEEASAHIHGARGAPEEPPVVDQARGKEAYVATPPERNPEPQVAQRKNPSCRHSVLSLIL